MENEGKLSKYYPIYRNDIPKDKQIELIDFEYIGMLSVLKGYQELFGSNVKLNDEIINDFYSIVYKIKESKNFDENLSNYLCDVYKFLQTKE